MEETSKTGLDRYHELQAKAKKLGIPNNGSTEQLEAAIEAHVTSEPKTGLTAEDAAKIDVRLKYEFDQQEKFRAKRQIRIDRATIVTEAESLGISIDLPEEPTELELAKARQDLGMKKVEIKPSPETLKIESSKRGYYIFTNREQDDASHTINPGGKYTIHLIPDQVHVLSKFHVDFCRRKAVQPVYGRVPVPGPYVEGRMGEECKRTGSKPRFGFEYLGEAPQDAPFGMVTDMKILEKVTPKEEVLL